MTLEDLGWTPEFREKFDLLGMPDLVPARVIRQDPYSYWVMTETATKFVGPVTFDARELSTAGELEQVVYVIPHDVPRFVTESCRPHIDPLLVSDAEVLAVLRMTEDLTLQVSRGQLHCRTFSFR